MMRMDVSCLRWTGLTVTVAVIIVPAVTPGKTRHQEVTQEHRSKRHRKDPPFAHTKCREKKDEQQRAEAAEQHHPRMFVSGAAAHGIVLS
jgi:hypothetical protein